MARNWLLMLGFLMFDVAVVAWGLWELRSVRRSMKKDREAAGGLDGPDKTERSAGKS